MKAPLYLLAVATFILSANAGEPALKVGDAAPAISVSKWLKGEPVEKFEAGKVYVIDFWGTWWPQSKSALLHLSKLQKEHADVVFIGIDTNEKEPPKVQPFIDNLGDKVTIRLGADDMSTGQRGKMIAAWVVAAGKQMLPGTFVVDKDSKIVWIGAPAGVEKVLKELAAGTFDAKKAAETGALHDKIVNDLRDGLGSGNYQKALNVIERSIPLAPELKNSLNAQKFEIKTKMWEFTEAKKLAEEMLDGIKDDPAILNQMAWAIVDPKNRIRKPDLELAEKLATLGVAASKEKDGQIMDTLARVYSLKGDVDKAIEFQTKAVDLVKDEEEEVQAELKKTLEQYKAAKK